MIWAPHLEDDRTKNSPMISTASSLYSNQKTSIPFTRISENGSLSKIISSLSILFIGALPVIKKKIIVSDRFDLHKLH